MRHIARRWAHRCCAIHLSVQQLAKALCVTHCDTRIHSHTGADTCMLYADQTLTCQDSHGSLWVIPVSAICFSLFAVGAYTATPHAAWTHVFRIDVSQHSFGMYSRCPKSMLLPVYVARHQIKTRDSPKGNNNHGKKRHGGRKTGNCCLLQPHFPQTT